jgi:hypothetical protein
MKVLKGILFAILLGGTGCLIFYNIKNNADFYSVPISAIVNIFLAIGITYYFTQRKNDERKQKDIVMSIIDRFQKLLEKECAYRIVNEDRRDLQVNIRGISNAILALKQCGLYKKIYKDEMNYIEEQFKIYREFIGTHSSNTKFLEEAEPELNLYLMNISSKLNSISVYLFCQSQINKKKKSFC